MFKFIISHSKFVFAIIWTLLISTQAFSQINYEEKLLEANKLYENGKLSAAIDTINICLTNSNQTSVQWKAYRLLAQAYLAQDDYYKAKKAAEKMLELNPTYQVSDVKDPFDFVRLLQKVEVLPKFSFGLAATLGFNKTTPNIISTYNGANYTKTYSSERGWHIGAMFGYTMNDIISLHSGLIATSKKFDINYQIDGWQFTLEEKPVYFDVPAFARFRYKPIMGIRPYIDAGIYGGYLTSYKSSFNRTSLDSGGSYTTNNLNGIDRHNRWEYGSIYGVGIMFNVKKWQVNIDAHYSNAVNTNIVNAESRRKINNLYYEYYYLDDDLRLNNLAVSLNFIRHLNYRVIKSK